MSFNSQPKTVVIIGGGFAGLAAAVFLDNFGFSVTLIEKRPILGGRAYAFQDRRTGSWVDNGQHLLMGAYHDTLQFIENIGATRQLKMKTDPEVPLITETNTLQNFCFSSLPAPFNLLHSLIKVKSLSLRDKWNILFRGRGFASLKGQLPSPRLNLSVSHWLQNLGQSQQARRNFWDLLTLATLNDDPDVASAQMFAVVLKKGFMGHREDGSLYFPRHHLSDLLAHPAKTYLTMRGQKIQTSLAANRIHVLDGRVQSVELDSGEFLKADLYISAVPYSSLLRLIPENYIQSLPYFLNLKDLKSSPILSVNLWFDREVIPFEFVGTAGRRIHWYFNRNRMTQIKGPPYHTMGVSSGAYDLVDQSKDEIMHWTMDEIRNLFPQSREANLIHSLVNKEREATLSTRVGTEGLRPAQVSPFENFYVIGDWTDTGYPATIESAVRSARLAVEHMIRQEV